MVSIIPSIKKAISIQVILLVVSKKDRKSPKTLIEKYYRKSMIDNIVKRSNNRKLDQKH